MNRENEFYWYTLTRNIFKNNGTISDVEDLDEAYRNLLEHGFTYRFSSLTRMELNLCKEEEDMLKYLSAMDSVMIELAEKYKMYQGDYEFKTIMEYQGNWRENIFWSFDRMFPKGSGQYEYLNVKIGSSNILVICKDSNELWLNMENDLGDGSKLSKETIKKIEDWVGALK